MNVKLQTPNYRASKGLKLQATKMVQGLWLYMHAKINTPVFITCFTEIGCKSLLLRAQSMMFFFTDWIEHKTGQCKTQLIQKGQHYRSTRMNKSVSYQSEISKETEIGKRIVRDHT